MTGADAADAETGPVPVTAPSTANDVTTGSADEATHGVDDVLGREVALVTLPPVSGDLLRSRVDRIRRLARLHHPHLVEVYDVDGLEDDAEHVLVLESVGGRPLDEVVADGPLPLARVAEVGARVASALAQAHRHGVVHGRLGPASVLVENDQLVWLVGLTASLQDEAALGTDLAAPTRADDLRALAATLAAAVAPAGADELDGALGPARQGEGSADELSGRLVRLARREAAPTDDAGAAYGSPAAAGTVGLRRVTARALAGIGSIAAAGTAAAGTAAAGTAAAAPTVGSPTAGRTAAATTTTTAAGATAAGATGATGADVGGRPGGAAGTAGTTDRPRAGAGRGSAPPRGLLGSGARIATLAAVALLLALTSGVVIWGQETRGWFGAAQAEPEASAPAPRPVAAPPPLPVRLPDAAPGSRPASARSGATESERARRGGDARTPDPSSGDTGGAVPPAVPAVVPSAAAPVPPPATVPPTTQPPTTQPSRTTPPRTTPPTTDPTPDPTTEPPTTDPSTSPSDGSTDPPAGSGGSADGTAGGDGTSSGARQASPSATRSDPDTAAPDTARA